MNQTLCSAVSRHTLHCALELGKKSCCWRSSFRMAHSRAFIQLKAATQKS
jgi:hypothetical protein